MFRTLTGTLSTYSLNMRNMHDLLLNNSKDLHVLIFVEIHMHAPTPHTQIHNFFILHGCLHGNARKLHCGAPLAMHVCMNTS